MATTYGTPVLFSKEKNVWILSARLVFGTNGSAVLDTSQSKGFCAVWQNTPTFTGGLSTGSSTTVGSVSSFQGLFSGQNLTISSSLAISASTVVSSITAVGAALGTFKISVAPDFGIPSVTFVAGSAGGGTGQYILQLGQQAAQRLDTYVKVLQLQHSFDETTGSSVGKALQMQQAPSAPAMVWIQNNTQIRTIPATATSGSTDASITVQFGSGSGASFSAGVPDAGSAVRIVMVLGNSTAP